jgi:hypothetical protein
MARGVLRLDAETLRTANAARTTNAATERWIICTLSDTMPGAALQQAKQKSQKSFSVARSK